MNDITIALVVGGTVGLCALFLIFSLSSLKSEVPSEDREYMDPLPFALRLVWPVVRFLEFHLCAFIPPHMLERTHEKLRARRYKAEQKALPVDLDFITLAVEAGLNLTGAINQAMDKGPMGPLRHEFFMVVRDLRSGLPRADALRRMEKRLAMMEITSMVGTIIQAEKMGARLGSALRSQAEQRRTERFQRAEKLAMEAPVKLIGPLMIFIFPITCVVIGFPIVVKYMSSGMM